jgi:hypothetical protein
MDQRENVPPTAQWNKYKAGRQTGAEQSRSRGEDELSVQSPRRPRPIRTTKKASHRTSADRAVAESVDDLLRLIEFVKYYPISFDFAF